MIIYWGSPQYVMYLFRFGMLTTTQLKKISDFCSELIFSPVLLWRPGKAQRHPPQPSSTHEISNQHTNQKTNHPNQSSVVHPTSSSPPHPLPHPQHTPPPPPATHITASSGAAAGGIHKDRSVRRIHAENLSIGKKGPLLIKTTDLTDSLPPQQSFESPLHNENKVCQYDPQGVLVGCGLGGACNHIKAFDPAPFLNKSMY